VVLGHEVSLGGKTLRSDALFSQNVGLGTGETDVRESGQPIE
jgi:hypothetical protein